MHLGKEWEKELMGDMNGRMSKESSERSGFDGLCGGREVALW